MSVALSVFAIAFALLSMFVLWALVLPDARGWLRLAAYSVVVLDLAVIAFNVGRLLFLAGAL